MKQAFSTLVKDYTGLLYYFTLRFLPIQDEADDIVSETFLKAFKSYKGTNLADAKATKSWLLAICHNTIRSKYRKKHPFITTNEQVLHAIPDSTVTSFLDQLIQKEQLSQVKNQLKKLSPLEQELITLRIYEEISFKHIAAIFDTSESAVKMKFYRSIQKIKEALI